MRKHKRTFALLNFFAFNVLFFAVYLNFIHKDANTMPAVPTSAMADARSIASNNLKAPAATPSQERPAAN